MQRYIESVTPYGVTVHLSRNGKNLLCMDLQTKRGAWQFKPVTPRQVDQLLAVLTAGIMAGADDAKYTVERELVIPYRMQKSR